jgi:hypothetical protein
LFLREESPVEDKRDYSESSQIKKKSKGIRRSLSSELRFRKSETLKKIKDEIKDEGKLNK